MTPTCPHCGAEVVSGSRGRPRRFCNEICTRAYHRPKPKLDRELHVLTDVDEDGRTATCSICGPGAKVWGGGRARMRWRCARRVDAQPSRFDAHKTDAERERKWRSRGIVGLTVEVYDQMVETQDGHCGLCLGEMREINVDHCHDSGRYRALLCTRCNTGLGHFGDDPECLRRAADYLERYS